MKVQYYFFFFNHLRRPFNATYIIINNIRIVKGFRD